MCEVLYQWIMKKKKKNSKLLDFRPTKIKNNKQVVAKILPYFLFFIKFVHGLYIIYEI